MNFGREEDRYPSRIEDTPRMSERIDPVVYGEGGSGPLEQRELDDYERNGFLFFERLFSEQEVGIFQDELSRLRDSARLEDRPDVILEPQSQSVRSIFDVHNTSPVFHRLARDTRLVNVVTQILNTPVYFHQSRINYKPGFEGKDFYWHSDFETWHTEDGMPRMRAISCSVNLSENNEHNGPLMVVPGSHKYYVACVGRTPENHYHDSLKKQEYGVPDPESLTKLVEAGGIVAPKGPAGSVVFFECNIMHGSNSNITPWSRSNAFFVYNSVENALLDPFCGLKPRPGYIAKREFTAIAPN